MDTDQRIAAAKQAARDLATDGIERRRVEVAGLDVREAGDQLIFTGHAAVFDELSLDLGGFQERIQRGAFRKVLDASPDVRFLINHEGLPLARTTNATLALHEDPRGLHVRAEVAPTTLGRDLATLVRRGDVSQMSFAFRLDPERGGQDVWDDHGDGGLLRTVIAFSDLFDVSAVAFPAYEQTDASMARAMHLTPPPDPERSGTAAAQELATQAGDRDEQADDAPWRLKAAQRRMALRERA